MNRRGKVLIALAGLFLAIVLIGVLAHYRARARLERRKTELRAQGEQLTIRELVMSQPAGSNVHGGQKFIDALSSLPSFPSQLDFPSAMATVSPGRARIVWKELTLPTWQSTNLWPELRAYLEQNQAALARVRAGATGGVIRFPVAYEFGFATLLPHLSRVKAASQYLSAGMLLNLRDGQPEEAWNYWRALIGLPVGHRDEMFLISQLVRAAMITIAVNGTWEALHYPAWSDAQLAEIQAAWEALDVLGILEATLRMERACGLLEYSLCRASLSRFDAFNGTATSSGILSDLTEVGTKLMEDPRAGFSEAMDRYPRRWTWKWWVSYADEQWFLNWHQAQLVQWHQRSPSDGLAKRLQALKVVCDSLPAADPSYLFAHQVTSVSQQYNYLKRPCAAEAQRGLVIAAIAIKRYQQRHGSLPRDLSVLAPEFLAAAPRDPMDGQPLRYRPGEGQEFLLYSVGLDGKDNGGDPSPADPARTNSSSRALFFMGNGKDLVWPMPASSNQIAKYHATLEPERSRKGSGRPTPPTKSNP